MNVKKYVKRPIAIEALQYTGDNRQELLDFTQGKAIFIDKNGRTELVIHTLEGDMTAALGCYIIRGPKGEFYPIYQLIFEETYEEVVDD